MSKDGTKHEEIHREQDGVLLGRSTPIIPGTYYPRNSKKILFFPPFIVLDMVRTACFPLPLHSTKPSFQHSLYKHSHFI